MRGMHEDCRSVDRVQRDWPRGVEFGGGGEGEVWSLWVVVGVGVGVAGM